MSKLVNGTCPENEKRFAIINPTSYNCDGNWAVTICESNELGDLGLDDDEIKQVEQLEVGERWAESFYGLNAQIVRLG
jgi:hypothetical protein